MTLQQIMTWWFFVTLAACGAYDVYAILFLGPNTSVSYELYALGRRMPTFYLMIGLLIGHLVLPLHVKDSDKPVSRNGTPVILGFIAIAIGTVVAICLGFFDGNCHGVP